MSCTYVLQVPFEIPNFTLQDGAMPKSSDDWGYCCTYPGNMLCSGYCTKSKSDDRCILTLVIFSHIVLPEVFLAFSGFDSSGVMGCVGQCSPLPLNRLPCTAMSPGMSTSLPWAQSVSLLAGAEGVTKFGVRRQQCLKN